MGERRWRWAQVAAVSTAFGLTARSAGADPKWSLGLEPALCARKPAGGEADLDFCGAVQADLMLLRQRSTDFGLGPSLRIGSAAFEDLRLDAGLSALLPLWPSFPLVVEAGPHLRGAEHLGAYGNVFFGLRSYNHYGSYEMAGGLFLRAERSFDRDHETTLWAGVRIDGLWCALPFLFLFEAVQ